MDTLLAGYLADYHRRTLVARSCELVVGLSGSPVADELDSARLLPHWYGDGDKIATALTLRELIKQNRAEITRLISWVKDSDGRGREAVERGKILLEEIEAASWFLEML